MLKTADYSTFFAGKWHLGEADYALPNAQGFDIMKYCGLYHLNAYTYADPTWFPDMDPQLRALFAQVTKGAMSGNAGETPHEDFKIMCNMWTHLKRALWGFRSLMAMSKRHQWNTLKTQPRRASRSSWM